MRCILKMSSVTQKHACVSFFRLGRWTKALWLTAWRCPPYNAIMQQRLSASMFFETLCRTLTKDCRFVRASNIAPKVRRPLGPERWASRLRSRFLVTKFFRCHQQNSKPATAKYARNWVVNVSIASKYMTYNSRCSSRQSPSSSDTYRWHPLRLPGFCGFKHRSFGKKLKAILECRQ